MAQRELRTNSLDAYMDSIGRIPLMTPEEEIHLGKIVRRMMDLRPDLCLLGANSVDATRGVTDSEWREYGKPAQKPRVLASTKCPEDV